MWPSAPPSGGQGPSPAAELLCSQHLDTAKASGGVGAGQQKCVGREALHSPASEGKIRPPGPSPSAFPHSPPAPAGHSSWLDSGHLPKAVPSPGV